ncbi:S9 family peptidase [Catenovulum sp. SM1970]|uniref:S9 family peptidase n=1 Tax=Marinifaba aquimaris TaxID=2741323 RepID=UPI00157290A1|nr:DPP IV N-terminal domain-containing protein [Marinifaba aquimaris]NTS76096.1 S9 family peptidase [Marinifaba aquimaris]
MTLRTLNAWLTACLLWFSGITHAEPWTIERIASEPSLSGDSLRKVQYAPDGSRITYLKNRTDEQYKFDLWQFDVKTNKHSRLVNADDLLQGKEVLSDEEKARRERLRLYGQGIVSYSWSADASALLFPLNGDVFYYQLNTKQSRNITKSSGFETDVKFSPNGQYISYIREQNLYYFDLKAGKEVAVTSVGGGTIKFGMAEFVAQEEMTRMTGYWWSPDSQKLALTKTDEQDVDIAVRNEIYADEIKLFEQRYPFTGTANAAIELGIYQLSNQSTTWLDLGQDKDIYLARVNWQQNSQVLSYQWQNRTQQKLELRFFDLATAKQEVALTETSNTWVNLHKSLAFLKDKKRFIWASERDGYKHLYLYRINELNKPVQLTKGEWVVDKLEYVDEKRGDVYFTGRKNTPLEKHLYKVNWHEPGVIKKISKRAGYHNVVFAKDGSGYIDNFSTANSPEQVSIHDKTGKQSGWLVENALDKNHPLHAFLDNWVEPRFGTLTAEDGQTLHYSIYKPNKINPYIAHPAIVKVYGGPHVQRVTNRWSHRNLWNQYMAQQGYVIFALDNRGSYYRGKAFEAPIYRHLADPEINDQILGAKYLASLDYVDGKKIGIFGHSYGGYMSLMAMFKAGDYFSAGVSGAPVTDWLLYDTHYTERYLGHPEENAAGYTASSVFPYAKDLKGRLLIYHGMADDNVLFTHSTKLYSELQKQGKLFEILDYPGSKHSMRGKAVQIHLNRSISDFFDRHLK